MNFEPTSENSEIRDRIFKFLLAHGSSHWLVPSFFSVYPPAPQEQLIRVREALHFPEILRSTCWLAYSCSVCSWGITPPPFSHTIDAKKEQPYSFLTISLCFFRELAHFISLNILRMEKLRKRYLILGWANTCQLAAITHVLVGNGDNRWHRNYSRKQDMWKNLHCLQC